MNCILLPAENFSSDTAKIDTLSQVSHVTKVLGANIGDTLKIGQIGANLGTAVIENITSDSNLVFSIQESPKSTGAHCGRQQPFNFNR